MSYRDYDLDSHRNLPHQLFESGISPIPCIKRLESIEQCKLWLGEANRTEQPEHIKRLIANRASQLRN